MPPRAALQSHKTTWFGILSRVAEGLGPLKPQQPVVPRDAGANSHPVRPGEIRCVGLPHLFFSGTGRGFFVKAPSVRLPRYPPLFAAVEKGVSPLSRTAALPGSVGGAKGIVHSSRVLHQ